LGQLYNDFNRNRVYFDVLGRTGDDTTRPSNLTISRTNTTYLTCPDDDTLQGNQGNLSYVCNMGFSFWPNKPLGWAGTPGTPIPGYSGVLLDWGTGIGRRMGLMFPGTLTGKAPWDYRTPVSAITDGTSMTVALTENLRGGANPGGGNPYSGNTPTMWTCAHPAFVAFMGSDNVCTFGGKNCSTVGDLI